MSGLYRKFVVKRTDGRDAPGEKHDGCPYFVLDIEHDEFALAALSAYADACRERIPKLAADIDEVVAAAPCGCRSVGECPHWSSGTPAEIMSTKIMNVGAR